MAPGSKYAHGKQSRKRLIQLDIPAEVLKIHWPTSNPLQLTNFESQAREQRYRCLALAAQRHGIQHLLLGHHHDDQIETAIMRLIRTTNPSALSLRGMESTAPIPACEGLWGICSRASTKPAWKVLESSDYRQRANVATTRLQQPMNIVEPGDLVVHRPLLPFSKASLVATCEANDIPYIQDKTNFDPTLTPRNAVRYLRSHHKLPQALQDESILNLIGTARQTVQDVRSKGLEFLRKLKIVNLSLVSGFVELSVPRTFAQLRRQDPSAAANVVERLCSLVSPKFKESNRLLTPSHLVDRLAEATTQSSDTDNEKEGFRLTVGKVLWETVKPPSSMDVPFLWRLSRCPPAARGRKDAEVSFQIDSDSRAATFRSTTILWDFRFWIRLQSSSAEVISAVKIRFLQPNDLTSLHSALRSKDMKHVIKMLSRYAPAHIRYTLPVLTIQGTVIAFPTLRADIINKEAYNQLVSSLGCQGSSLKWQVHYKAITQSGAESAMIQDVRG